MKKDVSKIKEWLRSVGADESKLDENGRYGGGLALNNNQLTSIEFPEGMTIGGGLSLYNNQLTSKVIPPLRKAAPTVFHWKWRNSEYIKADGIFQKVISHKGNVYRVQNIGKDKITYLVTDGNGKWSHGDTLPDAKEDLIYKISNRDKSAYESLTLDSVLTHAEAIEAYRVITGACSAGTKAFVTSLDPKQLKESYTIREIIELTKGRYGASTFAEFFKS